MNKRYLLSGLIAGFGLLSHAQAPIYDWARQFSGETVSTAVKTDPSGNVVVGGQFSGTADFNPGIATFPLTAGSYDGFVCKLADDGSFLWAKQFATDDYLRIEDLTTDNAGNVYVSGYFGGTADFDPGTSTQNFTAYSFDQDFFRDGFLVKLSSAGDLVWAKQFGNGWGNKSVIAVDVDASQNVFLTGRFDYEIDADPGSGTALLNNSGDQGTFVICLNPSGDYVWSYQITGDEFAFIEPTAIALNAYGNPVVAGGFGGLVQFDPASSTQTSSYGLDAFVVTISSSGSYSWAKTISGSGAYDLIHDVKIDNAGDIIVTGGYEATVDLDPGPGTVPTSDNLGFFVCKWDENGNYIWGKSSSSTTSGYAIPRSISLDWAGDIYTTGLFVGSVDFDPGSGVQTLTTFGDLTSIFVTKMSSAGNHVWAAGILSSSDVPEDDHCIDVDAGGNIYTVSSFEAMTDFNPGSASNNLSPISGSKNGFVQKMHNTVLNIPVQFQNAPIQVSPNPATSYVVVGLQEESVIELLAPDGRIILSQKGTGKQVIDLQVAEPGIYFIRATGKSGLVWQEQILRL